MDRMFLDLNNKTNFEEFESVHLSNFPVANKDLIDKDLEKKMSQAQIISSLVLSLRAKEKIKVRQPLQKIMIPVYSQKHKQEIIAISSLIKQEVNVKEVEVLEEESEILVKRIKPNFKVLGPRFGKDMKLVVSAIQQLNPEDIQKIEQKGAIELEINGKSITLNLDDVEISSQDIEGWLVANQGSVTVALDITVSDSLKQEGIARELVNRIQNLRKNSGFEVTDYIDICILDNKNITNAVLNNLDYIKIETLTKKLELVKELDDGIEIDFDGISTKLLVTLNK
jgi:isoleucyl-tRNA synthetase